ncbi:bacteriophage lambda head decoration protein D [Clostridium aceticum]|uniref:Bacteriophage lambda head decoration protein D n=1 Tax=Clostridium aceticum TaxID=84022 RepID=A0A0D8ICB0_9CLOT|nr:head decoration protein [Clostridium aceticum]AKL95008.1 bacteriophage lambda head decoration protein D [Clostridium aceticum]KJF27908.1 hypothetical protein TZ02_04850 [Clostridium aceticum]
MYKVLGEFIPDNLIAGNEFPILTKGITLAKDQGVLLRGTVVGIVTATGLGKIADKSESDGAQNPYAILTDTVDTGEDDVVTTGYISGLFNAKALIFGGEDTAADHEIELRKLGIYLKESL